MAYVRKTYDEYEIQGFYALGWDAVVTEFTFKDANTQLRCYEKNEPRIPFRIIKRRIRKENLS